MLREGTLREGTLRFLIARWRAEECALTEVLAELQDERDRADEESAWLQAGGKDASALVRRCTDLARECDDVANELIHVRLALQGAREELARWAAAPEQPAATSA